MTKYTPTVDEVRDRYADGRTGIGEWTRFDESVKRAVDEAYAEFDRWLAEVKAQVLEEAADEIFVQHDEITAMQREAFHRGADAVYNALRARAAEIREEN